MAEQRPLKAIPDPDYPGKFKLAEFEDGDSLPAFLVPATSGGDIALIREGLRLEAGLYLIGEALPGTGPEEAKWRIHQLDLRNIGGPVKIFAYSDTTFVHVWNDAETFTYA